MERERRVCSAPRDFGCPGYYYYVEERVPRFFGLWHEWREVEFTRADTAWEARAKAKEQDRPCFCEPF